MASLDSVRQKIYRAKMHFDELLQRVVEYYESDPGKIIKTPESPADNPQYRFQEKKPVPAIIP